MRILQAPSNIANQPWLMAEGLRALGHEVEVWEYGTSAFDYQVERSIDVSAGVEAYFATLVEAVNAKFDVVHFHYGRSLMPAVGRLPWLWDLPLWRALGVKVVFTFHGSDVRLRSHHIADDQWSFYRFGDVPCDETQVEAKLAVIRRYAQQMTVGSVLDQPYVPEATYVQKIVDPALGNLKTRRANDRPVVLHAPSRRATKGTDLVLAGLEELRQKGVPFDLDLVEGLSHGEAMERMARADVVVEKLLGGDAGVTSLEAMSLGKVAVARIRDQVREQHPDMPVVSADPTTFVEVMSDLLTDRERRVDLGARGRRYVEEVHSPIVVGRVLEDLYVDAPSHGATGYPGWTVPRPEQEAEKLRLKLEKVLARQRAMRRRNMRMRRELQRQKKRRRELVAEIAEAEERIRRRPWSQIRSRRKSTR